MKHEVKLPLVLVNGKFIRGGIEEAPEIGNPEQIALLQKAERESAEREKRAKSGDLPVDIYASSIRYDAVCEFTCVCGEVLRAEVLSVDVYSVDYVVDITDFEKDTFGCSRCGRRYEIHGKYAKLL